jgi:hypothetical protein
VKVIRELVPPFAPRKVLGYSTTDGLCGERRRSGDRRSQDGRRAWERQPPGWLLLPRQRQPVAKAACGSSMWVAVSAQVRRYQASVESYPTFIARGGPPGHSDSLTVAAPSAERRRDCERAAAALHVWALSHVRGSVLFERNAVGSKPRARACNRTSASLDMGCAVSGRNAKSPRMPGRPFGSGICDMLPPSGRWNPNGKGKIGQLHNDARKLIPAL